MLIKGKHDWSRDAFWAWLALCPFAAVHEPRLEGGMSACEDVDRTALLVAKLGAVIVRGPEEREWAPGYYYVLFEDPDGIRLEVNFIPGAGLLKEGKKFVGKDDYVRVDGQDKVSKA
jgi:hypothetical protein